jgi:hypothetical protein
MCPSASVLIQKAPPIDPCTVCIRNLYAIMRNLYALCMNGAIKLDIRGNRQGLGYLNTVNK